MRKFYTQNSSRLFSTITRLSFRVLFFVLVSGLAGVKGWGQTMGIYENYAIVNINGAGNTFYDLNANTGNLDFQGANLGTFNHTQTLVLAGAQNKTFKCSGGNVTGGNTYYRIYLVSTAAPAYTTLSPAMSFVSNDAGGCGGNQTWQTNTATVNVLQGLGVGTYNLEVYTEATGTPATATTASYTATFSVNSVFGDNFNRATLTPGGSPQVTYTNTNTGSGTSATSGSSFLQITNGTTAGRSYTTMPLSSYASPFSTTLASNTGIVTWTFNVRTTRTSTLGGFGATSYAQAVVLCADGNNLLASNGYAVVYGGDGTNRYRLAKFTSTSGLGATPTDIITPTAATFSASSNYVSIRVTYNPATNGWQLFTRDDGATAWADPSSGVTTSNGSATDATFTGTAMSVAGFFWNYSTAAGNNGQFDNVNVQVAPSTIPTLSTPTATVTSSTSATLGATVTSNGGSTLTARGTAYKTTAGVAASDNPLAQGGTTTGAYSHSRTGLSPETQYFYVGYATNTVPNTGISSEASFRTWSNPPTGQASGFTTTTGNASLSANWSTATFPASGATKAGYLLIYAPTGTNPALGSANGVAPAASAGTLVTIAATTLPATPALTTTISSLTNGTLYNLLLIPFTYDGSNAATYNYLTAAAQTTSGTPSGPATVTSPTFTVTSSTDAALGASITNNGGSPVTARGTVYKISGGLVATDNPVAEGGSGNGTFTHARTGFSPQTQYYFAGYATNSFGTAVGTQGTFYTWSNPPTAQASNIIATPGCAKVDFSWDAATFPATGASTSGYILIRAVSPNVPSITNGNGAAPAAGANTTIVASYTGTISGAATSYSNNLLNGSTSYNYQLIPFTWNGSNTSTLNYLTSGVASIAVTTLDNAPTISTLTTVTSITNTTASTGGSGISGNTVTQKGVVYNTAGTPTTANSLTNDGTTNTGFSSSLTGLSPETNYYVRSYALNTCGTGYNTTGAGTQFRTWSNPPLSEATAFTATSTSGSSIALNWNAASFPATGATSSGYIILRRSDATPILTTGVVNGAVTGTLQSGTTKVTTITSGSTNTFPNTGLTAGTTYYYLIIPYTWDGTNAATYNYYTTAAPSASATPISVVYTWADPANGGSWTSNSNWSPVGVPANGDQVIINPSATIIISNVPTVTLNSLSVGGSSTATLTAASSNKTISIGSSGTLIIAANSGLVLDNGGANLSLNFTGSGNVATINGKLSLNVSGCNYSASNSVTTVNGIMEVQGGSGSVTSTAATLKCANGGIIRTIGVAIALTVPIATWQTGSTYELATSTSGGGSVNFGLQNFHNVKIAFNITGNNAGSMQAGGTLTTINGDLIVNSTSYLNNGTNKNGFRFVAGSDATINIAGNLTVNSPSLMVFTSGTGYPTVNLTGNLVVNNGGVLDFNSLVDPNSAFGTLNLKGDLSVNGNGEITVSGDNQPLINFVKSSGTQQLSVASSTSFNQNDFAADISVGTGSTTNTLQVASDVYLGVGYISALVVNSGSKIDFGTKVVYGTLGTFNTTANSTLLTGNAEGITNNDAKGSVQLSGVRTYHSGANYVYNGSVNQVTGDGLPTPLTGALTISNSGTSPANVVSLSQATTLNGTTNLTSGILDLNALTLTISSGGSQSIAGSSGNAFTITGSAGSTISLTGTASHTISLSSFGTTPDNGLVTAANVNVVMNTNAQLNCGGNGTSSGMLTVKGKFIINSNVASNIASSHPPFYGNASTLVYKVPYTVFDEWKSGSALSTAGVPQNVTSDVTGGTITMPSNSSRSLMGNLTITNGTFALNGGDLSVGGNWLRENSGTTAFVPNGKKVTFNGSDAQTLEVTGSGPNKSTFANFAINNSSSGLTLNSPLDVTGIATFTLGNVKTTTTNILTLTNTAVAAVVSGGSTSYVNGPLARYLLDAANNIYIFPVGSGSSYLPFAVKTQSGTSPELTVQAYTGSSGGTFDNNGLTGLSNTEYWNISNTGTFNGGVVSLARTDIGSFNAVGYSATLAGNYNSLQGAVSNVIIPSNTVTSTTATGSNIGYFVLASALPAPTITSVVATTALNGQSVNTGYFGQEITITGTNFASDATVTINGAAPFSFSRVSATEIRCIVNTTNTDGDVLVTNPSAGTSATKTGFSILGYITRVAGDWNTNATWLGGDLGLVSPQPAAASTVTINDNTVTINAAVANAPASVTVTTLGNLAFGNAGTLTVNNSITNNGTINMVAGGGLTMGSGSTLANTGTFTGGIGAITFNGTNNTVTGQPSLNNVTISGSIDFVNNAPISGVFTLNAGSFVTNAPTYIAGSTLRYNTGGTYSRNVEWNNPYHVQLSGTTRLRTAGAGGINKKLPLEIAGNLTVDQGSNFSLTDGTAIMDTVLEVHGNIILEGTLTGSTILGRDVDLYGNWYRSSTGVFTHNNRAVFCKGTSNATISREAASAEAFPYLLMSKSGAGDVTLLAPVSVSQKLTLGSGKLNTDANNLLSVTNTAATSIEQGSISSFINGPASWKLPNSSATDYIFPVGSGSTYLPFAFSNHTGASSPVLTVQAFAADVDAGAVFDPNGMTGISHTEYWTAVTTIGTLSAGKVSLARASLIGYNLVARGPGAAGTYATQGGIVNDLLIASNTVTSTANISGTPNYYVLATALPDPVITSVVATTPLNSQLANQGYFGQEITINGTGFAGNATVTFNTRSAFTIISQSAVQIKAIVDIGTGLSGSVVVTNPTVGKSDAKPFALLGYITRQPGDWNTNATWMGSDLTNFNSPAPVGNSTVTINDAVTITAVTINPASVIIDPTGSLTQAASTSFTTAGLTNNGTLTTAGTFNITGASTNAATKNIVVNTGGTINLTGTVANSGIINVNGGTLQISQGGSVTGNAVTYGGLATLIYAGSTAQTTTNVEFPVTGTVNVSTSNATILYLNGSKTVGGDFRVSASNGQVQSVSGTTATLTMNGAAATLQVLGSFMGSLIGPNNRIALVVSGAQTTVTGNSFTKCNFLNVTVPVGSKLILDHSFEVIGQVTTVGTTVTKVTDGYFAVDGTLQMNDGANTNAITITREDGADTSKDRSIRYSPNSHLIYNYKDQRSRWMEWQTTWQFFNPGNVTIQNNGTVVTNAADAGLGVVNNLNLGVNGSSGSLDMFAIKKGVVIGGNVTIGSNVGNSLLRHSNVVVGATFQVNGNWTRTQYGSFIPRVGKVSFGGSNPSTITVTHSSALETFYLLSADKSPTGIGIPITLTSGTKVAVDSGLTLNRGNFVTSAINSSLTVNNTASGAVVGGRDSSYVDGPLERKMLSSGNAVSYLFPVGKSGQYLPFSSDNPITGVTVPVIKVEAYTGPAPNATTSLDYTTIESLSNSEHWKASVVSGNLTSGPRISLTGITTVNPSSVVAQSTDNGVVDKYHSIGGTPVIGTKSVNFSLNSDANLKTFAIALACGGRGFSYPNTPYCKNAINPSPVFVTGAWAGVFSAPSGLSINASTGVIDVAASTPGTYTVTNTSPSPCTNFATATVTITADVGTPSFTFGSSSTRCQAAGTVTYTATATTSTGITYSLDGPSISAGNSINTASGTVTYAAGFNGTSVITASAAGCNGPKTSSYTVTTTALVATPVFALGTNSTRCQGAGVGSYSATALNTTGITYTLNATSLSAGNTIDAATGNVTFVAGYSGTSTITASAAGCSGPRTSNHTVTVTASVTTPVFAIGSSSTRCQGGGNSTYTATATNTTGITYSLDATSSASGNSIDSNGVLTFAAGYSGLITITASAAGCNGPLMATHTISITSANTFTWTGSKNNDWNDVANWKCGTVPSSTSDVTIPTGTPLPILAAGSVGSLNNLILESGTSISVVNNELKIGGTVTNNGGLIKAGLGTITYTGSAPQTISAGLYETNMIMNLNIANIAGVTLNTPLAVTGNFNFAGANFTNNSTLTLQGTYVGGTSLKNDESIILTGSFSSSFPGAGTTISSFNNLDVNNSLTVHLDKNLQIAGLLNVSNGKLAIETNTLMLNGSFSGTTANGLIGSKTSNLEIGPSFSTGILHFNQTPFSNNNYLNALTLNSSVTLGDSLNIAPSLESNSLTTGFVKVNNGILNTGDLLVLVSDATGTARIAQSNSSSNYISGALTVQRYIPKKRAWRLVTAPLSNDITINKAWQEGMVYNSENGNNYIAGTSTIVPKPFVGWYGVHITGGTTLYPTGASANAAGFDYGVRSGTPSIRIFDAGNWNKTVPGGTLTTKVRDYPAYMLFPRGDRTIDPKNVDPSLATNSVIRATGNVKQTDQPSITLPASSYVLVGNPFPSPIDYEKMYVDNGNGSGIANKFVIWDSRLNTFGGYRMVQRNEANSYLSTPFISGPNESSAEIQHIQSGQGFFVRNDNTSPVSFTIKESHKSENTKTNVFSARKTLALQVNLQHKIDGNNTTADGITVLLNDAYQNSVDNLDATKLINFNENLSIVKDNKDLIIEARQVVKGQDTIFMKLWNTSVKSYDFVFKAEKFGGGSVYAYLLDDWKKTKTPIELDGSLNTIKFDITNDANSKNQRRFSIVLTAITVLPINFSNVKAFEKGANIQVEWNLGNEQNMKHYEVEKSTDGRAFTKAGMLVARANMSAENYQWLDQQPNIGNNYYRIKAIDKAGDFKYSQVVNVKMGKGNSGYTVYPNPVTNHVISLQMVNQPKGKYSIRLLNQLGQEVYRKELNHIGGSATETLQLDKKISSGTYNLKISSEVNSSIQQVVIN